MSESVAVKILITPLDRTLRAVFIAQRSDFIDIYQRLRRLVAQLEVSSQVTRAPCEPPSSPR